MNYESLRTYCLSKDHSSEKFPFDEHTLVFYVADKMFALIGLDDPDVKINLKCAPDRAVELREAYEQIKPGFHMNKTHWNTVCISELEREFIKELIDHSYQMVVLGFSKKKQKALDF